MQFNKSRFWYYDPVQSSNVSKLEDGPNNVRIPSRAPSTPFIDGQNITASRMYLSYTGDHIYKKLSIWDDIE